MGFRWVVVWVLSLAAFSAEARAQATSAYRCYSDQGFMDKEPRVYCSLDCEAKLARSKRIDSEYSTKTKYTECAPATGSVWCTMALGPPGEPEEERCFPERDRCISGSARNVIPMLKQQPLDPSVCVEKGGAASTSTTVAASDAALTASTDDSTSAADTAEPGPPAFSSTAKPHHYMLYGGLLAAGEEPDNTTGGVLGLEHRVAGAGMVSYAAGFDAAGHYSSGDRGFGGRVAIRGGVGVSWGSGSMGLTTGIAYGGVERSAAEIPFELFVNGSVFGIGLLMRYEQVHRFVDPAPMEEKRFLNASGFSAWAVLHGKALDPKLSIGIRMQQRDDTDAAFFLAAWGLAAP